MINIKRIFKGYIYYFLLSAFVYFVCIGLGIFISHKTKLTIHPTDMKLLPTLLHNWLIGAVLIIIGIVSFGLGNTLFIGYNGLMLGITLMGAYNSSGITPIISGVIPHAVTEILATLICCTLGYESLRYTKIIKRNAKLKLQEQLHIKDSLILASSAFLLFTISAFIETFISHAIN